MHTYQDYQDYQDYQVLIPTHSHIFAHHLLCDNLRRDHREDAEPVSHLGEDGAVMFSGCCAMVRWERPGNLCIVFWGVAQSTLGSWFARLSLGCLGRAGRGLTWPRSYQTVSSTYAWFGWQAAWSWDQRWGPQSPQSPQFLQVVRVGTVKHVKTLWLVGSTRSISIIE